MLPENRLSDTPVGGRIVTRQNEERSRAMDYELGGVALNDSSLGLQVKTWQAYLTNATDIYIRADNVSPQFLFSVDNVAQLGLAFDQNMRWSICVVKEGKLYLNWYDTLLEKRLFTYLCPARSCKMTLDDKRPGSSGTSDIVLAYLQEDKLIYRQQRDRFLVEYQLKAGLDDSLMLRALGMNNQNRLQFELSTYE